MNRVCLVANLTRDPELRDAGGTPVANMRVAWNTRRKGEDYPNFINVTAFGKLAELCAAHLAKGRKVAIDGRLQWREWESESGKREAVEIVADNVTFLGSRDDTGSQGEYATREPQPVVADDSDFPF